MTNDLVSIITPVYNCATFLREAIESVRAQSYSNWEMIIVDDASSDGSLACAEGFGDPRIRCLRNEVRSGAAVSRNRALREAQGRWVAFLDADDIWAPHKLEHQLAFMRNNGYAFSYTGRGFMAEDSTPINRYVTGPRRITKWGMFCFCWPGCLSVMYDSSVVGLIQVADLKKNNDYAMWLKVATVADCHLLDEDLATYRVRKGSISNHSYLSLIKWHYRMFRISEEMGVVPAFFLTGVNLFFGVVKKVWFTKRRIAVKV